jgi:hypothetical protein
VRRLACTTVAVLALSLAGATGGAAAQDAPYADWNAGYAGFPGDVGRNAVEDCVDGSRACIDATVDEMYRRFHTVIPRCDHNAVFSLTYIRVTEQIRRLIDAGFYPDRAWIGHLDRIFARIYFVAYDNWAGARRALVPPAWRIAFDTARARSVSGIGNLLLSMNGHINRDFPFVLHHAGLVDRHGRSRKIEHDAYNAKLRELYRPVLTELSHRFDETIDDYDAPGTELDDDTIFQVLVGWREAAWRNAERLAAARSDGERRAIAADIEEQARLQAETIRVNTAYRPGEGAAARDARCLLFGGQDPSWRSGRSGAAFRGIARPVLPRRGGLRMQRGGAVVVTLRCPAAAGAGCTGTLILRAARRRIGTHRFRLRAGARRTYRVRLTRPARGLLRRRGSLRVRVALRSIAPGGRVAWTTRTATLSAPRPHR